MKHKYTRKKLLHMFILKLRLYYKLLLPSSNILVYNYTLKLLIHYYDYRCYFIACNDL